MINIDKLTLQLQNSLDRAEKLRDQRRLLILPYDNSLFDVIIGLKNTDHWEYMERKVKSFFEDKNYDKALRIVVIALKHLETKTDWKLKDGKPAFSNLAVISEITSKAPLIGKFFYDITLNAHFRGIIKMQNRLKLVAEWLTKLEEHFNPSLTTKMVNLFKPRTP